MTENKTNEEFSEDNIPVSNWMKFSKVGDWIVGTFNSKNVKAADGKFKAQMVYVLTNVKGAMDGKPVKAEDASDEWSVGMTIREGSANYINNKLAKVVPGQRMGIKFEKEIPPKVKGYSPAKSYMPNVFGMDPDFITEDTFGESETVEEGKEEAF